MSSVFRRLFSTMGRPLFISQIASSLYGAGAVLIAAMFLMPEQFGQYALLALAANFLMGFFRASLFQPALVVQRELSHSRVSLTIALVSCILAATLMMAASVLLQVEDWHSAVWLGAGMAAIVFYDWVRFRLIAEGRHWPLAIVDVARILSLGVLIAMRDVLTTGASVQILVGLTALPCALALSCWLLNRPASGSTFGTYWGQSRLQTLEYIAAQLNTVLPTFVFGAIVVTSLVGGLRFGQTLVGPLNMVFAALALTLTADGVLDERLRNTRIFVKKGTRQSILLCVTASLIVCGLLALALATPVDFSGVDKGALIVGLGLAGAVAITSGLAGLHVVMLRLLGGQKIATVGRWVLVLVVWSFYGAGYIAGGVDGALVVGFAASALFYPLVIVLPARRFFKHRITAEEEGRTDG
ncbi:hypothetical protein [Nesterenkonia muleiensis]|uniref:hypothetical protein n=1 Tax=Nesterenkonia muleiensis TaxID=2282648 RepID=UPI00130029B2|nr:hypothetical protein [Nesterenkonia muleiensis]